MQTLANNTQLFHAYSVIKSKSYNATQETSEGILRERERETLSLARSSLFLSVLSLCSLCSHWLTFFSLVSSTASHSHAHIQRWSSPGRTPVYTNGRVHSGVFLFLHLCSLRLANRPHTYSAGLPPGEHRSIPMGLFNGFISIVIHH